MFGPGIKGFLYHVKVSRPNQLRFLLNFAKQRVESGDGADGEGQEGLDDSDLEWLECLCTD